MQTPIATEIDDDTFAYDGGFSQCISGFGRNAANETVADVVLEAIQDGEIARETERRIRWRFGELVRWCRHFNGKSKRLQIERDAILKALKSCQIEIADQDASGHDAHACTPLDELLAEVEAAIALAARSPSSTPEATA